MHAFVMTVYDEPKQDVALRVAHAREVYPNCEFIICYDGLEPYGIEQAKEVHWKRHIKVPELGGTWTHQWMREYLRHSERPYVIKIDPDTMLVKPLEFYPVGEIAFGTRHLHGIPPHITPLYHGGAIGYARALTERITREKWLLAPIYRNNISFHAYNDLMVSHMFVRQGLAFIDHPEFACRRPQTPATAFFHK